MNTLHSQVSSLRSSTRRYSLHSLQFRMQEAAKEKCQRPHVPVLVTIKPGMGLGRFNDYASSDVSVVSSMSGHSIEAESRLVDE